MRPVHGPWWTAATLTDTTLPRCPALTRYFFLSADESVDSAATKASCGTSTRPMVFIRF
jgi:hypothetical protein